MKRLVKKASLPTIEELVEKYGDKYSVDFEKWGDADLCAFELLMNETDVDIKDAINIINNQDYTEFDNFEDWAYERVISGAVDYPILVSFVDVASLAYDLGIDEEELEENIDEEGYVDIETLVNYADLSALAEDLYTNCFVLEADNGEVYDFYTL